jgi:ribonuclease HI
MTKMWVDGAGWNGEVSKFVIVNNKSDILMEAVFEKEFTNNEMEYMAMMNALKRAEKDDEIYTDSQLIYNQIIGIYKTKNEKLKPMNEVCKSLLKEKQCKIFWVKREQNKAGKVLEKKR